jgi:two-component system, OmpR family, sensor histidine kinase KdpD
MAWLSRDWGVADNEGQCHWQNPLIKSLRRYCYAAVMKMQATTVRPSTLFAQQWPGLVVWLVGWLGMLVVDGQLALSSLAMLLVLSAAVAALWLRLALSLTIGLLAVLAFNWLFVPPRGTFAINLQQDATLLLVMFAVSMLVAALMSTLREHAHNVQQQAQALNALRHWGDTLRDATHVQNCLPDIQQLLNTLSATHSSAVLLLNAGRPADDNMAQAQLGGQATAIQLSGLWHCLRNGHPLGPGSARYPSLPEIYLPLRGRSMSYGAALLCNTNLSTDAKAQAQALCDQMGVALERQHWQQQQQLSAQTAKEQELRATLLTAIAHDYRTPLATIMSAASALEEQDARLNQLQRQQLAHRIVDESTRLRQLTSNILQLARLDSPNVQLHCDWETAEELVGSVVQRYSHLRHLVVEVATKLPLLWCDSLLVSQLLDNLLDNASKYSGVDATIRLTVHSDDQFVIFSVSDNGPGISPALQQVIFQPFQQGQLLAVNAPTARRAGVGLGLALCRIIASVHGGELRLRSPLSSPASLAASSLTSADAPSAPTNHGCCFEFRLPQKLQPKQPAPDAEPMSSTPSAGTRS